jgi:LmbE family N-acetylglucosaminyl deacetylase
MPPVCALVIVAHPDDVESHAGETVAKLARAGTRIAYCIATNGEKGSGDRTMTPERLATIRQEEQRQAARVLGVHSVEFLGFRIARSRTHGRPGWPSRPPSAATARVSSWFRIRIGPSAWAPRVATIASWARSHWTVSPH